MSALLIIIGVVIYVLFGAVLAGLLRRFDKIEHEPESVMLIIAIWPMFMLIWPMLWVYSLVSGDEV